MKLSLVDILHRSRPHVQVVFVLDVAASLEYRFQNLDCRSLGRLRSDDASDRMGIWETRIMRLRGAGRAKG